MLAYYYYHGIIDHSGITFKVKFQFFSQRYNVKGLYSKYNLALNSKTNTS